MNQSQERKLDGLVSDVGELKGTTAQLDVRLGELRKDARISGGVSGFFTSILSIFISTFIPGKG